MYTEKLKLFEFGRFSQHKQNSREMLFLMIDLESSVSFSYKMTSKEIPQIEEETKILHKVHKEKSGGKFYNF